MFTLFFVWHVMSTTRIYLDNAATSWPKPEAVYRAVEHYQRELGAAAGRSAYREAAEVERLVTDTRFRLAKLIGAPLGRPVIFTSNCTDALNLALHGLLRPGDHVVTTATEHNSVLRPLRYLETRLDIRVSLVPCNAAGIVDPQSIAAAIQSNTRLIAMTHASNVTGALQPIEDVGSIAVAHGIVFLVDAAQSIGHVPIDVQASNVHVLAAPGHKGLLGPLGTGFLYVAQSIEPQLQPLRQGGTGTRSESDVQPNTIPDGYEPGNLNVPGILGLRAGVGFVVERGLDEARRHEQALVGRLLDGLTSLSGVTVHGPANLDDRVGVVSVSVEGYDPQEVAVLLDTAHSIQVRSGLHCASRIHAELGTLEQGGTVRFSTGPFNTLAQMDLAVEALAAITTGFTKI
jgi:cysteine desulfurase family protein